MNDVDGLTVTISFCLADDVLDEELDLVESYLGELLIQAGYLAETEE